MVTDWILTSLSKENLTVLVSLVSAILVWLSELRGGVMLSPPVFGSKGVVFLKKKHAHSFMNSFRVSEVNLL